MFQAQTSIRHHKLLTTWKHNALFRLRFPLKLYQAIPNTLSFFIRRRFYAIFAERIAHWLKLKIFWFTQTSIENTLLVRNSVSNPSFRTAATAGRTLEEVQQNKVFTAFRKFRLL